MRENRNRMSQLSKCSVFFILRASKKKETWNLDLILLILINYICIVIKVHSILILIISESNDDLTTRRKITLDVLKFNASLSPK